MKEILRLECREFLRVLENGDTERERHKKDEEEGP